MLIQHKCRIKLNKPPYFGASILEVSKALMYDFTLNIFKINKMAELLFTDTDSLMYERN